MSSSLMKPPLIKPMAMLMASKLGIPNAKPSKAEYHARKEVGLQAHGILATASPVLDIAVKVEAAANGTCDVREALVRDPRVGAVARVLSDSQGP
eukprot:UN3401